MQPQVIIIHKTGILLRLVATYIICILDATYNNSRLYSYFNPYNIK